MSAKAAPQPTPKHFTDEELKQQYGIHLATRLQADGDGKEAKWADIDDDEDDWAPETIEWNDGTKVTLSQNDPAAIFAQEQAAAAAAKQRQEEENKSRMAAQQKPTTTVGPNATVLKPRSAAQPKTTGLVLKTPSDKPTLVAKPAAPAPVRSPWASLPPVDRVPPVAINPPSQPPPSRPQYNEPNGNNSMPPPPPPPSAAVEIAADDFTRTRRDAPNGNLGQLYNAQSGQYEPANAGRRGSMRKEQNFRAPSVLQRGSINDQYGPAEPSAAFQTHRSASQQDASLWSRRRSSVVSGDSGPQGRRTSTSKGSDTSKIPNDVLQQRRESLQSQPLQSPSTPGFPQRESSPAQQLPRSALQSPALQHSQLSQDSRPAAVSESPISNTRDDVAAQKQLMKEKREMAIKRKKEEEEREEAAKKERIRLKMEKLGLPPLTEKKEAGKKEPEKKEIEKRGSEVVKPEKKELEKQEVVNNVPQAPTQPQEVPAVSSGSPPKPPVPDASGTPQQYGMMRVHGAPSNNVPPPSSERLIIEKTRAQAPPQRISPPGLEPKVEQGEPLPSPMVNGVTSQKQADHPMHRLSDVPNQNVVREPRQQPWGNAPRDPNSYTGWNGQGIARDQSTSSNVWGPPSHSRTLGNGTFDRSVQRPQSRPQEQFASPALAPIGPPRNLQRPREQTEPLRPNEASPAPVVEDFQTIPSFPPSEAPAPSISRPDLTSRSSNGEKQISPHHFINGVQPKPQINNMERPSQGPEQQRSALAAWGNSPAMLAREDAEKSRQLAQQHAARLAEEVRTGIRHEPQLPVMNETWRQVRVDEQGGQRHIVGVSRGQNTHGSSVSSQMNGDVRSGPFLNGATMTPVTAASVGRGSRFFPSAGRGVSAQYPGGSPWMPGYPRSPSPPPPDTDAECHPAFIGDRKHPLVNLPYMKEKPKVRLPPSVTTPVQSPRMAEVRAVPFRAVSQPLVNNPSWQDRFNGLLGVKKTSPDKKFAHVADFSATKVPLDLPSVQFSASVSLPPRSGEATSQSLQVASKDIEDEEALFENREFGSLPVVLIPTKAPEVGWEPAKPMKKGQYKQPKLSKEVEAASREPFVEREITSAGGILIFVKMMGMAVPKSATMPRRDRQNGGHGASRPRNFSGNAKSGKGAKSRESSGNYNNSPKPLHSGPQRSITHGGPNQHMRTQPSKSQSVWGSRVANAVH